MTIAEHPEAAIYAALRSASEEGLTITGLKKRLPFAPGVIQRVLREWKEAGHVTVTQCELRPGDTGPAVRYALRSKC